MSSDVLDGTKVRASGKTTADEVAEEQAEEMTAPFDEEVTPEERGLLFDHLGFHRMPLEWSGENAVTLARVKSLVDRILYENFADLYAVEYEVWDLVRTPLFEDDPEVPAATRRSVDHFGRPRWVELPGGGYQEDWSRLTETFRQQTLMRITFGLFVWEQRAATLRAGHAMFAKGVWTQEFARHFDAAKGTIEARTARGNIHSAEDRFFAIYQAFISQRADALVRSMERIHRTLLALAR